MMKRISTGLVALLLIYGTAYGTTLTPLGKTDGLSLTATREQNANIAALQTVVDTQTATPGVVTASKAVIVDASKDAGDFRNLDAVNVDAGASGTAGTVDVFPTTASKGKLAVAAVANDGDTVTTISNAAMGQASVVSIPDPGAATANFVLTSAANDQSLVTATAVEMNYLDITTLGTGAASKAVVLDTGDDYTWPAAGILTYGVLKDPAGTTLGATVAELNQAADVSARIVPMGATGNIATTSEGRIIRIGQDGSANTAITLTLPEATGSGAVYRVLVNTTNTGGLVIAALTTDTMVGIVNILDLDAAAQGAYQASGTDDKITLNSTTTGGQIGDWLEFVDYADTIWQVKGSLAVPTSSNPADPFSAT